MKDSGILVFLAALSLCAMSLLVYQQRERFLKGVNDFMPLYSGAILLDTGDLYDHDRLMEVEKERIGWFSLEHGYIRLPFHAALVKPLTALPYLQAYAVWQTLSLLAVAGFVILWRPPQWPLVLLLTSLSIPIAHTLLKGQDVNFLLLAVATTRALHVKGRVGWAGATFSLCAAKFHLFLLTPVWVFARRDWTFLRGFLGGGAVLALISFAAGGLSWPLEFIVSALEPSFSPGEPNMPNLHGAAQSFPGALAIEALTSVAAAALVWFTARRAPFETGLGAALIGGVLLSRHSYMLDTALILPACLAVIGQSQSKALRVVAFVLLLPVTALAVGFGAPLSTGTTYLMLILLAGMAWEANRTEPELEARPEPEAAPA